MAEVTNPYTGYGIGPVTVNWGQKDCRRDGEIFTRGGEGRGLFLLAL